VRFEFEGEDVQDIVDIHIDNAKRAVDANLAEHPKRQAKIKKNRVRHTYIYTHIYMHTYKHKCTQTRVYIYQAEHSKMQAKMKKNRVCLVLDSSHVSCEWHSILY